jgi:Secretion system C-terminal sorting domain
LRTLFENCNFFDGREIITFAKVKKHFNMNKFIYFFTFFTLFFAHESSAQSSFCSLPAPTGLAATVLNSSTVDLSWNPVAGAWGYQVQLTNLNNSQTTTTQVQNNFISFNSLPANTPFEYIIQPACSPTTLSDNSAKGGFETYDYLVLDDINTNRGYFCRDKLDEICPTETGMVPYVEYLSCVPIAPSPDTYIFSMVYMDSENPTIELPVQWMITRYSDEINISLVSEGGISGWPSFGNTGTFKQIKIWLQEFNNAKIIFGIESGNYLVYSADPGFDNFKIEKCPRPFGGSDPKPRSDNSSPTTPTQQVVPNPFTNELALHLAENTTYPVQLALTDISGRVYRQLEIQETDVAGGRYEMEVDALPVGLYFLKTKTATGEQQVHKVVKME